MTTEHGKELWKNRIRVAIDHHLSRWTARHIAVSQDGLGSRHRRERVPLHKLILIPNGVTIPAATTSGVVRERLRAEFGLEPRILVIGTVGRIVAAKGYEHLLAALPMIRAAVGDVRWLAVGDGDQRENLAARARELALGDAVVWAGIRHDVGDLLQAMDIWVMSSLREGLPVALLEAIGGEAHRRDAGRWDPRRGVRRAAGPTGAAGRSSSARGGRRRPRHRRRTSTRARRGRPGPRRGRVQHRDGRAPDRGRVPRGAGAHGGHRVNPPTFGVDRRIPVVMVHAVGDPAPGWIWPDLACPEALFAQQVELLAERGYRGASLDDVHAWQVRGRAPAERLVVFTFDDGYLGTWVLAYPLLERSGLRGLVYVNPDFVEPGETPRPTLLDVWAGRVRREDLFTHGYLNRAEVRALGTAGVVDVGSHSRTHTWYASGPRIVGYHGDGTAAPWLAWNARPERKPTWLTEDQSGFVPLGTPIQEHGRSLGIRRWYPDPAVTAATTAHVAAHGGRDSSPGEAGARNWIASRQRPRAVPDATNPTPSATAATPTRSSPAERIWPR